MAAALNEKIAKSKSVENLVVVLIHFPTHSKHRTSDFLKNDTLFSQLLLKLSYFSFSLATWTQKNIIKRAVNNPRVAIPLNMSTTAIALPTRFLGTISP